MSTQRASRHRLSLVRSEETEAEAEALVSRTFPDRRVADHIDPTRKERRTFKTMEDKLAAVDEKHEKDRRFSGDPITDLGDLL
jgi:uncharacterized Ntn-hydrolase superfamily protein